MQTRPFSPNLLLLIALSCASLTLSPPVSAQDAEGGAGDPALKGRLDKLLNDSKLSKVKVGVHVRDLDSGETLYGRNADTPLNPASNIKLVTAAAVLDKYGPGHTFTTELHATATSGDTITGDLVLKGGGDPFLLWSHLLEMAERARRKGFTRIKGDIVIDDTVFDDAFMPPAFDQKSEDSAYRASVSGAAAEFGALTINVTPRGAGEKPRITFDPPNDYATVQSTAVVVKEKDEARKEALQIKAAPDGDRTAIQISGKTWPRGGATVRKRMDNPSLYTGYLLRRALKLLGITVEGKIRRGPLPGGTRLLARHTSYTMNYNIAAMQKWSNNYMAEMLFKSLDMGDAPATWAGAQKAALAFLEKAGVKGELKLTNGSGLYDANALSAAQFTQVLYYLQRRPDILPDFESSFAIAGVDGTLKRRMKSGPANTVARGKTGTLSGVVTLTGYVQTLKGRRIGFSVLFNDTRGGAWGYRRLQDDLVEAITDWGNK
ncbi:MAG: D-alanyl-D-alanine carboxypeptidase/D-alanyl-D-alanine-endopeptidase [Myxococcales bacterium]|nr:D-alanyl-D-alanine carboxypeptidase/D-alanyl-D-alanine-endopeptidase [Myxococcales bacterium]